MIVVFAAISAIATLFYSIFSGWTLYEIHHGSEDTHKLAEAAKRQADKAETISISIEQAASQLTENVAVARKQDKAAQDGVDAVRAQMRQDQRPLLKTSPVLDHKLALGETINGTVTFQNIGKTSAKNVDGRWYLSVVQNNEELHFSYPPKSPWWGLTTGAVYPNDLPLTEKAYWIPDGQAGVVPPPTNKVTQEQYDSIRQGKSFVVLYGRISYDDGFGIHHWTRFCTWEYFVTGSYTAKQCTAYNAVDSNR